jgi:parallel beta-helix repeat protein
MRTRDRKGQWRKLIVAAIGAAVLLAFPLTAQAKVIKVSPGDSIQAAVDQAEPGDTVKVAPGTYTEASKPCPPEPDESCAVAVEEDGIRIVGRSGSNGKAVRLLADGDQDKGISVGKTDDPACLTDPGLRVHGSLLKGITVEGFEEDGVFLYCVQDWRITRIVALDNLEYGTYPSHSFDGRLDHSFASGANDTGHYVGQSFDSRMDHNVATDNVSGFEIENSTGIRADHNLAFGNTGGILSFTLPFLDVGVNQDNVIAKNIVRDNDRPNTCIEPEEAVCEVPPGTGILLMAVDDNLATNNLVTGNDSFGIAVANICIAQMLDPEVCAALDIERNPDGNRIVHNQVTGNGQNPDPALPAVFAVDLAWDTTGTGNCWSRNVFDTSFPPDLPEC